MNNPLQGFLATTVMTSLMTADATRSSERDIRVKLSYGPGLIGLFAVLLGLIFTGAADAAQVFVTNAGNNTIGEYTTSGSPVIASLISGLSEPNAIAVSGSDMFVGKISAGTIGEYTTSGSTVNASLISGLSAPAGIAVSGSDLFVANAGAGTIGEYSTSGSTVNASLISGLSSLSGIAVSGSDLF